MSRIGRLPITVPAGVTVTVDSNNLVTVKGPKGTLSQQVNHAITVNQEGNMLHLMGEIPVEGVHHRPAAGKLLEGQGRNELGGVFGHDDLHRGVLLDKGGGQSGSLIGGNSAGDAQKDGFSFQHREPSRIENCLPSLYPDFELL